MSERSSPRTSYTAAFKLRVIAYAVSHGNRAAGRQFWIDESCVRLWRLQHEHLKKNPLEHANGTFSAWSLPEIEKKVAAWKTEKCQGGIGVSTNVICLKAKSVTQKLGIAETSFKASQCWCYGLMERSDFELKYIGNANQTPLTFDIVTNSTVSEKGVKSVSILKCL